MALELTREATIAASFGELLKVVVDQRERTLRFKTVLKRLESTLRNIKPVFNEIAELSQVLNRPDEETEKFIQLLEHGKKLVVKGSRIHVWNVHKKYIHTSKLINFDAELMRFFQIDMQMKLAGSGMKSLIDIYDLTDKFDRILGVVGSCSVPGVSERIIGLDRPLSESKRMLLKEGTRVLVISAAGGHGKTTLAKMLCHDDEIKETFGHHILYVTVSRTSSLMIIAQKLFEHHGKSHCDFQNDEDARNQLENLLRQTGSDNMLLVLDDVWPETESLIQELKFQIPGYKILVTSRFLFPMFNSTYQLSTLTFEDARTLFCYSAFLSDKIPKNVSNDLVNKMVNFCKGLPLALTVVGASLCGRPTLKWITTLKKLSDGESIFKSNRGLLLSLQTSIDALDELPILKKCFFDLGSFPEDDLIAGTALMDMWAELYDFDDEGMYASEYLHELSLRNLVNLNPIREDAGEIEGYCSEHYVTQHDMLRELAIHLSGQDPVAERKWMFLEIHRNDFPTWWTKKLEQPLNARILSISTDEAFSSSWYDLNAPNVEVLVLNISSKTYTLPQFIKRMSHLKVLILTGYGNYPTQLENLQLLGSLSNLRRIRFERVSVSQSIQVIFALQNLKKLAFLMCKIGNGLNSCTTEYPNMLPNLKDLEIDHCDDLKELPAGLCSIVHLEKLRITNCHELDALPKGFGTLSNLQTLRLHSCIKLQELPDTIGTLHSLSYFDISDCLNIKVLPEEIGGLIGLRVLNMRGCRGLKSLPVSMSKLSQLEDVICDEETSYLWKTIESDLCNMTMNLVEKGAFGQPILHDDDTIEEF